MTTSIERIREQVARVREEHTEVEGSNVCWSRRCGELWPCPTLRLAEKMLKLAEALEAVKADTSIYAIPKIERILAECAEEKR